MAAFNIIYNNHKDIDFIETALTGYDLLQNPKLNKGCAFTPEERDLFGLTGLLPHQVETLEQQVARMYMQYQEHHSNLGKNIYLNMLHDYNETLFYALVSQHLEEMLPVIYTPTVGEAVARFSLEHRKPRGIYISYADRHRIAEILDHRLSHEVDLIVVTDGEAVLGIGDQGIGGMNISSAKLMVYTLCGGISPHRVLPIQLDVGTNNPHLLADPMYLGWRHERVHGQDYDDFIQAFVQAVMKKLPNVFLHWEDFGRDNARRILTRYRETLCTLNGDMQSTGVVALASVLAGVVGSGLPLADHQIVIFGAGTAGVGIADQLYAAMCRVGISEAKAKSHLWLLDKQGLLMESAALLPFQKAYAHKQEEVSGWECRNKTRIDLYDVVKNVKPTILVGCSTLGGAFTQEIVSLMAAQVARPVIMPLSNPTELSEAKPEDVLHWTKGKAMIATGSPFPDIFYDNRRYRIAQSNNALAFPGIGLGAIAVRAKRLTDTMLAAATQALSECSPVMQDRMAPLLPRLSEARMVSFKMAMAVAATARQEGLAQIPETVSIETAVKKVIWDPRYYPYRKVSY